MIFLIPLFIFVVIISFFLAKRSMRDYKMRPLDITADYGFFLIKKPENLTPEVINLIGEKLKSAKMIFALERLIKGGKTALCIFGPKTSLAFFSDLLGLFELLDYSKNADPKNISVWGLGPRSAGSNFSSFVSRMIPLNPSEEAWIQIVLEPNEKNDFLVSIKGCCVCSDALRRTKILESISRDFIKVPHPFSAVQMLKTYTERVFDKSGSFKANAQSIYQLVSVSSVSSTSATESRAVKADSISELFELSENSGKEG
jgi:hypothetical protein